MFQREKRYVVLKNKDVAKYLSGTDVFDLNRVCLKISEGRYLDGKPEMNAVVLNANGMMRCLALRWTGKLFKINRSENNDQ